VLAAYQPVISQQAHRGVGHLKSLYTQMLPAIAQHRVADRPDRCEPRMTTRRPKNYDRLTKPRKEITLDMIK
jgi:hydroxypyruvate isomerase